MGAVADAFGGQLVVQDEGVDGAAREAAREWLGVHFLGTLARWTERALADRLAGRQHVSEVWKTRGGEEGPFGW